MANYWAIAIGINQYQHFQPLMYAQRDAYAFRDFLIKEALFPAKCSFLLSDTSPRRQRTETYPTRDSIQACITRTCQQRLKPGDFLWCFFSGYGIQVDGKDYLMPIDGNPDDVVTTGIPIELLFSTFETAPTQNIILVLDVNRSQSAATGEGLGDQTALLAREHGIPTVLSCFPDQFSHETLTLRHGLFTAALIEAMRRGCVTLEQLVQYLNYRVPELSEQHWRPQQHPLAIIPSEKRFQLILPEKAAIALGTTVASSVADDRFLPMQDFVLSDNSIADHSVSNRSEAAWTSPFANPETGYPPSLLDSGWEEKTPPDQASNQQNYSPFAPAEIAAPVALNQVAPDQTDPADAIFWRRMLTWSSIIAAALLIGVVVRNAGEPTEQTTPTSSNQPWPTVQSGVPNPAAIPNQSAIQATPGSPLETAYLEVRSRNYAEAKQFLNAVPQAERGEDFENLLNQANRGLLSDAKIQLTRIREMTEENQAADFVEAISIAQLIRQGEPQHPEAQQHIDRWSQVILDMAQGRAERRNDSSTSIAAENYSAAIATANLIPPSSPEVYRRGQEAIAQWSQSIFDLANDRADEAKYDVAVQTAELIPPESPIYEQAQTAIAKWQEKPSLLILPTP